MDSKTGAMDINVLIIGKSGVGKSSLLNYLFGSKAAESGTGRPVTEKGIYSYHRRIDGDINLNIYDTWGLEADKADEWKRLILNEVKQHDHSDIKDWFHVILYCFSAKSARIEKFEEDIISELLEEKNKVITVLTHCDLKGIDQSLKEIKERLFKLTLDEGDIICVCSEGKKLLGGIQTEPFGREQILVKIKEELWERIQVKLPQTVEKYGFSCIERTIQKCRNYSDSKITIINIHSKKVADDISSYCNEQIELCAKDIEIYFQKQMLNMFEYFYNLCHRMLSSETKEVRKPYVNFSFVVNFRMDFIKILAENISSTIFLTIPGLNLLVPKVMSDIRKEKIAQELMGLERAFKEKIQFKRMSLEAELRSIKM
ncbi:GTPase family protein [Clostridium transplantifaecale]|uniref:GTPase family protein n=1 Tax=Clostridium transplantifaecale TaxID=2479838 RepID=UPI000F630C04|nr:GTPase domain-containing protein [Clostridium transplantifaecale]